MSYEIRKPITEKEHDDFIVEYNHNRGLRIEDTEMFLFALEDNEMMGEKEIEIEVPDFETVVEEYEDENGESQTREIQNQTGNHIDTITVPYPVINPHWEEEESIRERERLNKLSLTKREVFLALYKDKGITPDYIKNEILKQVQDDSQNEALIEFEYANDYFRGNPLIGQIGAMLGYTSDDLDYLFEHKELPAG